MSVTPSLVGQILHCSKGFNCTRNEFVLVLKETPKTVQVVELKRKTVSGDWMDGTEEPIPMTPEEIANVKKEDAFRIQKSDDAEDGSKRFWGRSQSYSIWDGKPQGFNSD